MPNREAHSQPVPLADEPSRNDGVTIVLCVLCGLPLGSGQTAWIEQPAELGGEWVPAHPLCNHELGLMRRAMVPRF